MWELEVRRTRGFFIKPFPPPPPLSLRESGGAEGKFQDVRYVENIAPDAF